MKNLGFFFIFAEQFNRCVSFLMFFGDDVEEDKDLTGCTYFYGYNTIVRRLYGYVAPLAGVAGKDSVLASRDGAEHRCDCRLVGADAAGVLSVFRLCF